MRTKQTIWISVDWSEKGFTTRLCPNDQTLDWVEAVELVGVWVTTWLDWEKNTWEICKKSYARVTMLTKLKYSEVSTEDLINIYVLYILLSIVELYLNSGAEQGHREGSEDLYEFNYSWIWQWILFKSPRLLWLTTLNWKTCTIWSAFWSAFHTKSRSHEYGKVKQIQSHTSSACWMTMWGTKGHFYTCKILCLLIM